MTLVTAGATPRFSSPPMAMGAGQPHCRATGAASLSTPDTPSEATADRRHLMIDFEIVVITLVALATLLGFTAVVVTS